MYLTAAIQSYEIILEENEGTVRCRWTAQYQDVNAANVAGKPVSLVGASDGTTKVTLFFGPATGYVRRLIRFSWNNTDETTHHPTVRLNDGLGHYYPETGPPAVLPTQSLLYHTKKGWYVFPKECIGYPIGTQYGGTGSMLDATGGPGYLVAQPNVGAGLVPVNNLDCGTS